MQVLFKIYYFKCQIKVHYHIFTLHPFNVHLGALTSLCIFSYSQTLSMETALVWISHPFLTQKFRDWVIWEAKIQKLNEYSLIFHIIFIILYKVSLFRVFINFISSDYLTLEVTIYIYTCKYFFKYIKLTNIISICYLAEDRMNIVQRISKESMLIVRNDEYQGWWDMLPKTCTLKEKKNMCNVAFGIPHYLLPSEGSPNFLKTLLSLFFFLNFTFFSPYPQV